MITQDDFNQILLDGQDDDFEVNAASLQAKVLTGIVLCDIRDELKRFNDAAYPEGLDTKRDREDLAARFSEKEIRDNLEVAKSKLNPVGDERIL